MTLADWIMHAATEAPPRGRESWAQAMRAEYSTLSRDKLSWAVGCWTTMLGWRVRADAIYLAALAGTVVLLYFSPAGGQLRDITYYALRSWDANPALVLMFVAMTCLSTFRPDRAFLAGVTIIAMQGLHFAYNDWYFRAHYPEAFIGRGGGPVHLYSASVFVGHLAEIGACCAGAILGAWLSGIWRNRRLSFG